jgi:hypothetical protein
VHKITTVAEEVRKKHTSIKITHETHERLETYGKFGDSFDDIINRVLDENDANKKDKK